jgi:phage N-6-adenine-methyltransferase
MMPQRSDSLKSRNTAVYMTNSIENIEIHLYDLGREELEQILEDDANAIRQRGGRLGKVLKIIRDKLFYKPEFANFEDYCESRWGFSKNHVDNLIRNAMVREDIESYINKLTESVDGVEVSTTIELPVVESHYDALGSVARGLRGEVWIAANSKVKKGQKLTAKKILDTALKYTTEKAAKSSGGLPPLTQSKPASNGQTKSMVQTTIEPGDKPDDFETHEPAEGDSDQTTKAAPPAESAKTDPTPEQPATPAHRPHVVNNSGENEWYTPVQYIEAARRVLGAIDLDPASCELANETVLATEFYTLEIDGLKQPWLGNVWLNPPYSGGSIVPFISKYAEEIQSGQIDAGIVLVNNATETQWFKELVSISLAAVFATGRIKFVSPEGEKNSPLQGQVFLYYGDNIDLFLAEFAQFGWGCQITEGISHAP